MKKLTEAVRRLGAFLEEVRTELKKCSWPSRAELVQSTFVVIVSVVLLAVYIGVCDKLLVVLVGMVFRLVHM